jgi:N-acetylated-alpha-linked acidic dipeptidase
MADAELLPLQFAAFADTVASYLEELHKLVDDKRSNAAELVRLLDQNAFALAADPTRMVLPPQREPAVPVVDFAPLDAVVARLKSSAQAYDESYAQAVAGEMKLSAARRKQLNALLQGMEQKLTDARGLPGREWFKHFVYAPGRLTGYGVKTLPAVREAIDAGRWDEANQYVGFTAGVLAGYCDRLDELTALLRRLR